jgi:hypothetical protein
MEVLIPPLLFVDFQKPSNGFVVGEKLRLLFYICVIFNVRVVFRLSFKLTICVVPLFNDLSSFEKSDENRGVRGWYVIVKRIYFHSDALRGVIEIVSDLFVAVTGILGILSVLLIYQILLCNELINFMNFRDLVIPGSSTVSNIVVFDLYIKFFPHICHPHHKGSLGYSLQRIDVSAINRRLHRRLVKR